MAGNTSGWNRPSSADQPKAKKGGAIAPSMMRGIVAGLAVAIVAGVCVFMFAGKGEKPVEKVEKKPTEIKEVTPAPAPKAVPTSVVQKVEKELPPSERRVKTLSISTNSCTGQVCERYQTADGKTHRWIHPSKPPIFKHHADQLLVMALGIDDKKGAPPLPPLRGNLDRLFVEAMKDPIVINPDDSPKVVEIKTRVQEARQQVDELMREGISFAQILADHEKLMSENRKVRNEMIAEIKKFNAETDVESTQKALESVNNALRNMGIAEIEMPKTPEESRALREARDDEAELE